MNWDELRMYLDFWSDFMENKTFEVKGTFKIRDEWLPYAKVIAAPNETQAQERTFALMGSKHRLKRRYIKVQAVNVIDGE
jgi:large subunit ribosomal protein LX